MKHRPRTIGTVDREIAAMLGEIQVKRDRDASVRCRVCGCGETSACNPPCSWVEFDLCSGCKAVVDALYRWQLGARDANKTALVRELKARFDQEIARARRRGRV